MPSRIERLHQLLSKYLFFINFTGFNLNMLLPFRCMLMHFKLQRRVSFNRFTILGCIYLMHLRGNSYGPEINAENRHLLTERAIYQNHFNPTTFLSRQIYNFFELFLNCYVYFHNSFEMVFIHYFSHLSFLFKSYSDCVLFLC